MRIFRLRYVTNILVSIMFAATLSAQEPVGEADSEARFTAPVIWTAYKIPSQNLSISLPKLPFVQSANDLCRQTEGDTYTAYADHAVYQITWRAKSDKPYPERCEKMERFGKDAYTSRVRELQADKKLAETDVKIMASPAKMFRSEIRGALMTRWLLWDIDRWFEITIVRRSDSTAGEEKLLSSFAVSPTGAAEIGPGSERILGDKATENRPADVAKDAVLEDIVVATKPRPGYTDAARSKSVQGTVVLSVTFLRNGSIGPITVVKGLELGLTEQAVAAAQRISFLPARSNGLPQTVVKRIEYSFSTY